MSQEKERDLAVQQRQHDQHLQETLRSRAAAELDTPSDSGLQAEARELTVEERQRDEHIQETMHARAASNLES